MVPRMKLMISTFESFNLVTLSYYGSLYFLIECTLKSGRRMVFNLTHGLPFLCLLWTCGSNLAHRCKGVTTGYWSALTLMKLFYAVAVIFFFLHFLMSDFILFYIVPNLLNNDLYFCYGDMSLTYMIQILLPLPFIILQYVRWIEFIFFIYLSKWKGPC